MGERGQMQKQGCCWLDLHSVTSEYAKQTSKWDLFFCDYLFSFEILQCPYIPMKYRKHLSLYRRELFKELQLILYLVEKHL